MYDIGKILVAGGGSSTSSARVDRPERGEPDGRRPRRRWRPDAASTTSRSSPTGRCSRRAGTHRARGLVDLNNGVYTAELWNPADGGTWRTLDSMQVTRQYHSTALLLPDGRVLSSGGGICGDCDARRLSGEERRGLLAALPVQAGRVGPARARGRRSPPRPGRSATTRRSRSPPPSAGVDRQGRAGPARGRDALGEHGAALRAALVHGRRREHHGDGPAERQRRAARLLHAVRDRHRRRAIGGGDGAGRSDTHPLPRRRASPTPTPTPPANDNNPEVKGSAEAGSTVRIYSTAGCTGSPLATGTAASFARRGSRPRFRRSDHEPARDRDRRRRQHLGLLVRVPVHGGLERRPRPRPSPTPTPTPPPATRTPRSRGRPIRARPSGSTRPRPAPALRSRPAAPPASAAPGSRRRCPRTRPRTSAPRRPTPPATPPAARRRSPTRRTRAAPRPPRSPTPTPTPPPATRTPRSRGRPTRARPFGSTRPRPAPALRSPPAAPPASAAPGSRRRCRRTRPRTSAPRRPTPPATPPAARRRSPTRRTRAAPRAPSITDTDPDSPANDNNPEVKGSADSGSTVRIYSTSDCSGTPLATGSAGEFSLAGDHGQRPR